MLVVFVVVQTAGLAHTVMEGDICLSRFHSAIIAAFCGLMWLWRCGRYRSRELCHPEMYVSKSSLSLSPSMSNHKLQEILTT